jgi:hypothetical protein
MPLQCTMRPSGMEVITRSPAPKQPEAPQHAVASGLSSWSIKSMSFSSMERDLEMLGSWRSVASLHEPSWDRLCGSLDWNESNPGEVAAMLEEVEPGADSISIFVAEAHVDKLSRSSTNLSRSLRRSGAEIFGFMSMRNRRKSPTPFAMQTHVPKTKVVPREGTDLENLKVAIELADGSSTRPYLARQLSMFNRLPTEGYTQGGRFWVRERRDQELKGTRNTKLRQVRATRCVIPYVL